MTANNCDQCHGSGVWICGDGQTTEVCPACRDYRAMAKTLNSEAAASAPTESLADAFPEAARILEVAQRRIGSQKGGVVMVIHATTEPDCCAHYGVDDPTFVCAECGRTVGYCMGRADYYPDICDDCWAKLPHDDEPEEHGSARCLPLLYCSMPFRNWEEVDFVFVTDSDIALDLAPLSRDECKRRGLKHSSEDIQ